MSKAKWFLLFLLAVILAIPTLSPTPSQAIELSLGGFPSFMRTRVRFIRDATFLSALGSNEAAALFGEGVGTAFDGGEGADDNITFVDTRLRLTPQLVLSDTVTIRAQVDVADNLIWGGANNVLERDVVFESVTPGDRFRGALLVGPVGNVLFNNLGLIGVPGRPPFDPAGGVGAVAGVVGDDRNQFFNVRMLHADIVLPNNLGFVRIGRQPFDWGIGLLANGGWDPLSDLGFVLDRFLYLKSFPLGAGTFTFVFVSDRLRQGTSLVNGAGDGWDGGAVALVYNQGPLTVGVYDFPYITQTDFAGSDLDLAWLNLYSGLIDFKTDTLRIVGELQGAFGKIEDATSFGFADDDIDIEPTNILAAVRAEIYPGFPVKLIGVEGGIAFGDENECLAPTDPGCDADFQGNVLAFSPAYNLDNLLFKHIIPNIYGIENSVINAFYGRAWGTIKLLDNISFTPQVVVAFNEETDNPLIPDGFALLGGDDADVGRYLGTEVEGTLTLEIYPGVNFDLIGSLVVAGGGLEDLIEQRAALECGANVNCTAASDGDFSAPDIPWAVQGRLLIYIDQFLKQ